MNEEIALFAEKHGIDAIIPVLYRGIPNNEAVPGREAELAFPDALVERMRMPLAVAYAGIDAAKQRPEREPFEDVWFTLLANLLDLPRDEVEQRERKRQAKLRNRWITLLSVVCGALLALAAWALVERADAARQRDEALRSQSTFLAQTSRQQADAGNHDIAVKLALHALPRRIDHPDRPWVQAAESALFAAVAQQTFRQQIGGARPGLDSQIDAVHLGADGKRAALVYGAMVELWNLESGELLAVLRSDDDQSFVADVALSADGRFVAVSYWTFGNLIFSDPATGATTTRGTLVQIADARSGGALQRFQLEGHARSRLRFSPSGKLLVVATDERFSVLATTDWMPVRDARWADLPRETAPPWRVVAFSDDERKLTVQGEDGTVTVFDIARGAFTIPARTTVELPAIAFASHDGNTLAVAQPTSLNLVDTTREGDVAQPLDGVTAPLAIGWARERGTLVAITADGRALSWPEARLRVDVAAGGNGGKGEAAALRRAAIADDGATAIVEFGDGAVEQWDLVAGARRPLLAPHPARKLIGIAVAADGSVALLAGDDSAVRVWDRSLAPTIDHYRVRAGRTVAAIAPRPGSDEAAVGYGDGSVAVGRIAGHDTHWQGSGGLRGAVRCLAFDAAGERLVAGGADSAVLVWRLAGTAAPLRLEGHPGGVEHCGFSPDGRLVVTAGGDANFRLWDAASGELRHLLEMPARFRDPLLRKWLLPQAVFSVDSTLVVTSTAGDGHVIGQPALVWALPSGRLLHTLVHEGGAIWDLALTPDGRHLVTTSYDRSAALWDLRSGERVRSFVGHSTSVLHALVVDDGRLLLTASGDGEVRVSRVATGNVVHQWKAPGALVNVAASRDQRLLAVASNAGDLDTQLEIWDPVIGVRLAGRRLAGERLVPFSGLVFAAGDRLLLANGASGALSYWTIPPTGQELIDQAWSGVRRPGAELLTREQRVRFAIEPP